MYGRQDVHVGKAAETVIVINMAAMRESVLNIVGMIYGLLLWCLTCKSHIVS